MDKNEIQKLVDESADAMTELRKAEEMIASACKRIDAVYNALHAAWRGNG